MFYNINVNLFISYCYIYNKIYIIYISYMHKSQKYLCTCSFGLPDLSRQLLS